MIDDAAPPTPRLPVGPLHPSARILLLWRLMARLWARGGFWRLPARFVRGHIQRRYGCYISPGAVVGKAVYLPHPVGIVIGDAAVIGDGATIYQNVTIGQSGDGVYPTIGAGAILYAGCVVVSDLRIGAGAVIGANAVVRISVPDGATAAGVPARVIRDPNQAERR
jgi:serine O-acetyltransferase